MRELQVGIFAIVTMLAIVIMSVLITSRQSGFGEHVTYQAQLRDAAGIFPKTPIRVAGINAGKITIIELVGNHALVTFEILKEIKVTKGSLLRIKSVGFLGDKYLEILLSKGSERLPAMSVIESKEGGGLQNITKDLTEVIADVKAITKEFRSTFAPERESPPLKNIMQNVNMVIEEMSRLGNSLNGLFSNESFGKVVADLKELVDNLRYQSDMENADSLMGSIDRVLMNVERFSEDLKELSGNIRTGRGTAGKFLVEEGIADEVQKTLAGVNKLVGKVDSIRTELSVFSGNNSVYGSETDAALTIFPVPERFYLLGIATSDFGPESEKHINTVKNGDRINEIRREKVKNQLRFNVQIGRQIQNWTFRAGLIESRGGLGVDYHLYRWGTHFSVEVFDRRGNGGLNIRPAFSQQLWNIFYGKVAFEDVSSRSMRSYTISGGLRFNDEDLKGLLAFFL